MSGMRKVRNAIVTFPRINSFKLFLFLQVCVIFLIYIRFYYQDESVSRTEFLNHLHLPVSTNSTSDNKENANNGVSFVSIKSSENTVGDLKEEKVFINIRLVARDNEIYKSLNGPDEGEDVVFSFEEKPSGKKEDGGGATRLECNSNIPVTWSYSGHGIPKVASVNNLRSIGSFKNEKTYQFHTTLDFGSPTLRELDTGKYSCSSIDKNQSHSSHFYIFVPGSIVLLSSQSQNNKIDTVNHDEVLDGDYATIPCVVSDPKITLNLYKEGKLQGLDRSLSYSPKLGFRITLSDFKNPWGTYTCEYQANNVTKKTVDYLLVDVSKVDHRAQRAGKVKVRPNTTSVVLHGSAPTLFECEANEELKISFPSNRPRPIVAYEAEEDETDLLVSKGSEYKYKASFIAMPWQQGPLVNGSVPSPVLFQCQAKADGIVLHAWEYSVAEDLATDVFQLTFSNFSKEFICCSNRQSQKSFRVIPCSSIPECEIQSIYENKIRNQNLMSRKLSDGCISWTLSKSESELYGIVQCSIKNDSKQIAFYTNSKQNSQDQFSIVNFSSTDTDYGISLYQIAEPISNPVSTVVNPYSTTLECSGSSFYFSEGFTWTIKRNEEDVNEVFVDTSDGFITEISEKHVPPFYYKRAKISMDIVASNVTVVCNAPVWNSTKWKTAQFTIYKQNQILL